MARPKKQPETPKVRTAIFRPDSRNGSKDFLIPLDVARQLFEEGRIWGDATNGGYMPTRDPERTWDLDPHAYIPREHRVPRENSSNHRYAAVS